MIYTVRWTSLGQPGSEVDDDEIAVGNCTTITVVDLILEFFTVDYFFPSG